MKKLSSLSIFFPVLNEKQNVPLFVKESLSVLPQVAERFEIIVVMMVVLITQKRWQKN